MLKHGLLGLLGEQARHGWELRARFEDLLGGTWPLNDGQVYTTLGRLERDGLVTSRTVEQRDRPDRKVFTLTDRGEDELRRWLREPPPVTGLVKDEFFLKVLVHCVAGHTKDTNPDELLHAQRQHYYDTLAALTQRRMDANISPTTALLLDGAVRRLEADLHWLDDVEQRLPELTTRRRPARGKR